MPAQLFKVPTPAKRLQAGDDVYHEGLVIAVEQRFDKIKVTFKGTRVRVYPNDQTVHVVTRVPPPEVLDFEGI